MVFKFFAQGVKRKWLFFGPLSLIKTIPIGLDSDIIQMAFCLIYGLKPFGMVFSKPDQAIVPPDHFRVIRTSHHIPTLNPLQIFTADKAFLAAINFTLHTHLHKYVIVVVSVRIRSGVGQGLFLLSMFIEQGAVEYGKCPYFFGRFLRPFLKLDIRSDPILYHHLGIQFLSSCG